MCADSGPSSGFDSSTSSLTMHFIAAPFLRSPEWIERSQLCRVSVGLQAGNQRPNGATRHSPERGIVPNVMNAWAVTTLAPAFAADEPQEARDPMVDLLKIPDVL